MKAYMRWALAIAGLTAMTAGCDDFGDVNIDPEHLNEGNVPHAMVFTNAQHQALGSDWDIWRMGCIYSAQWVQHLGAIENWWPYALYYWQDGYSGSYWTIYSSDRGAVRDVTYVMDYWNGMADHVADYNIARIMRVYIMHRMTDLYGDVPYSQAGRPQSYSYPVFDRQQEIYDDMFRELNEAQANLRGQGTAPMASHDVYFQGNTEKWRKFANALMLRLALRLSKVAPETGRQWAQTAVSNGLMESIDDNVLLRHPEGTTTDDSAEPYAKIFAHESRGEFFLSNVFVDMLKNTGDPRLPLIGTVCERPKVSHQNGSDFDYGDSNPDIQRGLPIGYSNDPTSTWFIGRDYPEFNDADYLQNFISRYSTVNRYTYSNPQSHTYVATYAQQQLLLAEAAQRGWVDGSAQTYYEQGVRAAMEQFSQYTLATQLYNQYLTEAAISDYLRRNPFSAADALRQINTQYWITCFCDEYESFSNWRRSGFPELVSAMKADNPYPSSATNGVIPRRFRYPTSESQVNMTNYNDAVSRLSGGDTFLSRVWWDVE